MNASLLSWVFAQTTTTIAESGAERNNFALILMSLAVVVLACVALGAPRLAKKINSRKARDVTTENTVE